MKLELFLTLFGVFTAKTDYYGSTNSTASMFADGCGAETVTVPLADLEEPVLLDWPEINLGEIASVQWDPCEDLTALGGISIRRTAIRTCEGTFTMRASWGPPMIQVEYNFDFTPTSRRLCNVANVSYYYFLIMWRT